MSPRRIVLDCDPGHDDAVAIVLAAGIDEIELAAITTVAGNQSLARTSDNALRVCALAGIEVPVGAGCDRPLVRPLEVAADIHGESGLDGAVLPEPTMALDPRHGVDLLIDTVFAGSGHTTVVATGPLTNVAAALRRAPAIVDKIDEIVLMGGAEGRGNVTPTAEFNIYVDPEAAAIVFESGLPVTMIGLDLTHQALATPEVRARLRAQGSTLALTIDDLLGFFAETYRDVFGFASPPVHDACAVAYVARSALVRTAERFVAVECHGTWTRGTTVIDTHERLGRPPNARVATVLDAEGFWNLVLGATARLGIGESTL